MDNESNSKKLADIEDGKFRDRFIGSSAQSGEIAEMLGVIAALRQLYAGPAKLFLG